MLFETTSPFLFNKRLGVHKQGMSLFSLSNFHLSLRCFLLGPWGIGLTEHSGCPVYEGEKKIVTQWIRLGVDDENPWDSFNTLGVKKDATDD